jgi:hypothetical protein
MFGNILLILSCAAAPFVAKKLIPIFRSGVPKIAEKAVEILTGIDDAIERKTGWDIPDGWQTRLDDFIRAGVSSGVAFAEQYVYSKDFWEKVIKAIVSKRPPDMAALVTQLTTWLKSVDWKGKVLESLPDELRPIVNEIKEIEATKVAQGQIAVNVGSAVLANTVPASVKIPAPEDLKPLIKGGAAALKLEPVKPLAPEYAKSGMTAELAAEISRRHEGRMAEYLKRMQPVPAGA